MSRRISLAQYKQMTAGKSMFQKIHRSRVYLGATVSSGALSYAAGKFHAFGYGQNEAIAGIVAGAAPTVLATPADTTILNKRTPPNGERVAIFGIDVRASADSEPYLLSRLDTNMRFAIRLSQQEIIDCGTLGDLGGVAPGMSFALEGPSHTASNKTGSLYHPVSNGNHKGLFFKDPIIWEPESGSKDGQLDVLTEIVRAVAPSTIASRTAEATTGEVDFTQPTTAGDMGTFVNLMVRLHCEVIAPGSRN